jgi:hypothetical protein
LEERKEERNDVPRIDRVVAVWFGSCDGMGPKKDERAFSAARQRTGATRQCSISLVGAIPWRKSKS